MKKFYLHLLPFLFLAVSPAIGLGQASIDTLAYQDFELVPQAPVWNYSGAPADFQTGFSAANATPANSPLGIGGSRAWHVRQVSGGNPLTFDNTTIPSGYDSIRVRFRLAGMNLNGNSGGPDNLDYVLVAYSTNGGSTFTDRLRVRGAVNNNCSWPYSAASTAKVYYLPANEQVFQPVNSGLQLAEGLGTVEIVFPGSITQLSIRITPRSSSSTDSWLVDNLVLEGQGTCTPSSSSIAETACDSYTAPSGAVYTTSGLYSDTIQNALGCDSIVQINLVVLNSSNTSIAETACDSYTAPSGAVYTSSAAFTDTIQNAAGCDSLVFINLVVLNSSASSISESACDSYTAPSGAVYTASGNYSDTIPNAAGCDSIVSISLTVNTVDASVSAGGDSLVASASGASYQWLDCNNGNQPVAGATSQSFSPAASGSYAVAVTDNGCTDTSACFPVVVIGLDDALGSRVSLWPNPAQDFFKLDFGGEAWEGSLSILDLSGKLVGDFDFGGAKEIEVPVSDLARGVYIVEVRAEGKRVRLKFVKE